MLLKDIKNRKSVRSYLDKEVTHEQIDLLLESASCAPSAHNRQPWEFIVVTERSLLDHITTFHKYGQMLKTAPVAIIVLGNKEVTNKVEFIYTDTSAAIQNMLIQATSMDLGTCWCALAPDEVRANGVKEMFNLPDHILPVAVIAVGYEDGNKAIVEKSLENKVKYNKYK